MYLGVEKLIREDPNLENWIVSYRETFSEIIAAEEEERMILEEEPRFNDEKMAGK